MFSMKASVKVGGFAVGRLSPAAENQLYGDFFAGFGFGFATGSFVALDENFPVCGGFGFPRILTLLFATGYFLS